ncbi:OmpW/AlkL family protein [Polynucleobacter kasalickyi]|uniref:Outer membrane protein n=1 Tax=Polynucleobacter kasalickyi TaxID=1938817 RepID=A0A1W2BAR9_9BURK|nr:OmpW family outer membrane protein [Polynucleobacter kasalickyi]SMC70123.1 outer membrane protein [Polynucleobacter kasalickyi]
MTLFRKSTIAAIAVTALGVSSQAFAQKAGDIVGYVGGALIVPKASLGPLTTTSASVPVTAGVTASLSGATAAIDPSSTITLGALYMWTDNIATELTIGIPPKMTVDVGTPAPTATAPTHPAAATAKVMNPSLVAKYLFNAPKDTLRPYVGLGVTYTSFSSVTPNTSDATVNVLAGTSASMSASWAPIFNVGAIYNIDEKWSVNASVSYVPLKTDVTFVGNAGVPITTTGTLTLNPWDFVVRLGYKF